MLLNFRRDRKLLHEHNYRCIDVYRIAQNIKLNASEILSMIMVFSIDSFISTSCAGGGQAEERVPTIAMN